jgi:hypothetical protein
MDLQRMNRVAGTVLLGGFAFILVFILVAWYAVGIPTPGGMGKFYIYLVFTAVILLAFLSHAMGTLGGAVATNPGAKPMNRFGPPYGWRVKEIGDRGPVYKFIVLLAGFALVAALIQPQASLENTLVFFVIAAVLTSLYTRWAYVYNPDPYTNEEVRESLTPDELNDPLSRELVVSMSCDRAFIRCEEILQTLWSLPMFESDALKGTIEFMFKDSRLFFHLSPAGQVRTKIVFSITPDLPAKWYPNKDRRENIRILEKISGLLNQKP